MSHCNTALVGIWRVSLALAQCCDRRSDLFGNNAGSIGRQLTARITGSGTVATGKWLVDCSPVTATNAGTVKASPCRILYGLEQAIWANGQQ